VSLFGSLGVTVNHVDRIATKSLEIAIRLKTFSDPWAADLEDISLGKNSRILQGFSHWCTETSAIIQSHIVSTGTANLDLHRHGLHVGKDLQISQLKPMVYGYGRRQIL
jgi:hypothetical protein